MKSFWIIVQFLRKFEIRGKAFEITDTHPQTGTVPVRPQNNPTKTGIIASLTNSTVPNEHRRWRCAFPSRRLSASAYLAKKLKNPISWRLTHIVEVLNAFKLFQGILCVGELFSARWLPLEVNAFFPRIKNGFPGCLSRCLFRDFRQTRYHKERPWEHITHDHIFVGQFTR